MLRIEVVPLVSAVREMLDRLGTGIAADLRAGRMTRTDDVQHDERAPRGLRSFYRRLDIRAPEAGLVLTRGVEPGQIISSGSGQLFRIAMGGQMEMRAQLS